jgi:hypothetical protein
VKLKGPLLDLALHTLIGRFCTERIVSLTRDVRDKGLVDWFIWSIWSVLLAGPENPSGEPKKLEKPDRPDEPNEPDEQERRARRANRDGPGGFLTARFSQSLTLFSGAAWSILKCARRTSTFLSCAFREQEDDQAAIPSFQARSLSLQGWGLIDLPLRASNEGLRRPRVARAQKTFESILSQLFSPIPSRVGW